MCQVLSWIEKNGKLLYMDNDSLNDSHARELIRETRNLRDVVGHGFIREYYNISGGKECEINDFWNTEKFPEEIRIKLENNEFSMLWEYMDSYNLRYIIINAPENYREKAWELFLNRNHNNSDLRYIIVTAPESYSEKACELLLNRNYDTSDLRYIIIYAPKKYAERAKNYLHLGNLTLN